MMVKLAWRNLFRNKRRTIIAGLAIGLGLSVMIFTDAFIEGMVENYIHNATSSFMGEAQISQEDFREAFEVEFTVENLGEVLQALNDEPLVEHYAPRISAFGTISSPTTMSGVNLFGIDPEREKFLSILDRVVVEGSFFEGDNPRDIYIGEKLAEILHVGLGDRVVLTTAQAGSSELVQELFRVSGIFDFGDRGMNAGTVFIRRNIAGRMLDVGETAHMIAVKFADPRTSQDEESPFWAKFSAGANEALSWEELFPQIPELMQMSNLSRAIMGFIIMAIVVFVILNTLFMSLYERMFEFGVIKALGTRAPKIAKLMIFEAAALALVAIVLGAIIGFLGTKLVGLIGIDFTGIDMVGMTIREPIRPVMNIWQFIVYPVGVVIFTVIIGLYPAVHAARLKPAEAMRKS